jgi:serine/threonine-protein kinase
VARADPRIGTVIQERYRIIDELGKGGMGQVYLAEQLSIGRRVALKVLHPEFARDDEFVARFRSEARQAASVDDPRAVTIHEFGQTDDGSLFIAMEYVVGRTLKDVIADGPLSLGRAVTLATQTAEVLASVHRAGLIHRDIKPENIMVKGQGTNIKLMDFGIARPSDAEGRTRHTRTGMILGTPEYMAPEQIEQGNVGSQTDLYAWGIVFYEMLTGDVPFRAPTPASTILKHLQETPQPPRALRGDVPAEVERIVLRALAKKPEDRPGSMEEVAAELAALPPLPDVAPPPGTIRIRREPTKRWVAIGRWTAIGGSAAAGMALASYALSFLVGGSGEEAKPGNRPTRPVVNTVVPSGPRVPDPDKIKEAVRDFLAVGQFYLDRGQYQQAIEEFESARKLAPSDTEVLASLERARKAAAAEEKILGSR